MKKLLLSYLLFTQFAFAQTLPSNTVRMGDGTASDKKLLFNTNAASKPQIKWNNSTSKLQFSNDGSAFSDFGSGSGGGTDGINSLAESNPDAENGTLNWTNSGGTFTATSDAAKVIDGASSFSFDASATSQYVESELVTIPKGLHGRACEARILYHGGDANLTLKVMNGDAETVASLVLTAHTVAAFESVFFLCPSSTVIAGDADKGNLKIRVESTADAAEIVWDKSYDGSLVGLFETQLPDVASFRIDESGGAGLVSKETSDIINGNCTGGGTGVFNCTFNSGIYTVAPNCVCSLEQNGQCRVTAVTSSTLQFNTTTDSVAISANLHAVCQKQGVDAKQSVQVYKSVPKVSENINEYSARISETSGTISKENVDWLSGSTCTRSGTNSLQVDCTVNAGVFTVVPNCSATADGTTGQFAEFSTSGSTTTNLRFVTVFNDGSGTNSALTIKCQKQGADFKMPTSQIVLVNQVTTSSENPVRHEYVAFGGATAETTNCSTSPCTIWRQSGAASSVTRSAGANYDVNWTAGKWTEPPNCTVTTGPNGATANFAYISSNTTSQTHIVIVTHAGTNEDGRIYMNCSGK